MWAEKNARIKYLESEIENLRNRLPINAYEVMLHTGEKVAANAHYYYWWDNKAIFRRNTGHEDIATFLDPIYVKKI